MNRTLVTVCTAEWSLYVPQSGHYMYRTVLTICTVQWSLYVPPNGHCMYRKMVTICTAQWSLYVPHNGHYMYRTVVNICTAKWSLYVPHSGHYMYPTMVTICGFCNREGECLLCGTEPLGHGLLNAKASRLHPDTHTHTHSVGLLWTRDQHNTDTSTCKHTTLTTDRHPCPWRDSNPQS